MVSLLPKDLVINETETSVSGEWMNPLNKMIIRAGLMQQRTTITLRNGMRLGADYSLASSGGKVWLQVIPDHKFPGKSPAGWFDLEKVSDPLWVQ